MKLKQLFLAALFGAAITLTPSYFTQDAQAGPGLTLSESVKAKLMAADPVLGKKVLQDSFDGKPVMVSFFASW